MVMWSLLPFAVNAMFNLPGSVIRGTQRENFYFYVITVLFVRFKGLFLNAKKNESVWIR